MLPCLPTQVKVDSAVVRKIPITLICVSIIRQLLNASHASRHGAHRDELSQGSCLVELTLGREERDEVISERVNEVALGKYEHPLYPRDSLQGRESLRDSQCLPWGR